MKEWVKFIIMLHSDFHWNILLFLTNAVFLKMSYFISQINALRWLYSPCLPLLCTFPQRLKKSYKSSQWSFYAFFNAASSTFSPIFCFSFFAHIFMDYFLCPDTVSDHGHTAERRECPLPWHSQTGKTDTQLHLPASSGEKEQKQNRQIKTGNSSTFCPTGPLFPALLNRESCFSNHFCLQLVCTPGL